LTTSQTRYETRTRVLDADGKIAYEGVVGTAQAVEKPQAAPPHPDVEGANPETKDKMIHSENGQPQEAGEQEPPIVEAATDVVKEKLAEAKEKMAKPASEGNDATQSVEA
jgi:dolichyl-phosphate-mannose-protein mannosyltransferase